MKLNQLRDVVAVAERGSLRSAARHLGLAQPALTRSIRELEHELGALLFERRASGMVLTPVGAAVVRRASSIRTELERVKDEVEQLKGVGQGTISIGLSTVPHLALLPRVLQPFRKRFPRVRLRISEGLFPTMEASVQDGMIDFYIGPLTDDVVPPELIVERLFENRRIVIGRTDHPLAAATSLADLTSADWASTNISFSGEAELDPVFDSFGLPRPRIVINAETAIGMMMVAAYSDLLAMLPQQWAEVAKSTGLIKQIAVKELILAPTICFVRRARLPLTPAAEHLGDLFRRAASNHARTLINGADFSAD